MTCQKKWFLKDSTQSVLCSKIDVGKSTVLYLEDWESHQSRPALCHITVASFQSNCDSNTINPLPFAINTWIDIITSDHDDDNLDPIVASNHTFGSYLVYSTNHVDLLALPILEQLIVNVAYCDWALAVGDWRTAKACYASLLHLSSSKETYIDTLINNPREPLYDSSLLCISDHIDFKTFLMHPMSALEEREIMHCLIRTTAIKYAMTLLRYVNNVFLLYNLFTTYISFHQKRFGLQASPALDKSLS